VFEGSDDVAEFVVVGGPVPNLNASQDSQFVDPPLVDLFRTGCKGEFQATRYSSLSEPEEVLSSHRSCCPKPSSRIRKHKQGAKPNDIGVPKFVQLVEAMKEAGSKLRRRRQKDGGGAIDTEVVAAVGGEEAMAIDTVGVAADGGEEAMACEIGTNQVPAPNPLESADIQNMGNQGIVGGTGGTPVSGINLISDSEGSIVPNSIPQSNDEEKEKLLEAAKLLSIQQEVGFTFEVPDDMTLKQLVDHERGDRAKKMDWERREGDQ
jgi:hypothetical protein